MAVDTHQSASTRRALQYLENILLVFVFFSATSIWYWPHDSQIAIGLTKPLGSVATFFSIMSIVWAIYNNLEYILILKTQMFIVLFLSFATISTLWSVDPVRTVQGLLLFFSVFLYLQYYVARYGVAATMRSINSIAAAVIVTSVIFGVLNISFVMMEGVHSGLWRGFFPHKNPFGAFLSMYIIFLVFGRKYMKLSGFATFVLIGIACVALVNTSSSTAVVLTVVIPLVASGLAYLRRRVRSLLWAYIILALLVPALYLIYTNGFESLLSALGRDSSFSGRDRVWQFYYDQISRQSFFGNGYQAEYLDDASENAARVTLWESIVSPHNGFIALALNLGWIGVSFYVLWLCKGFSLAFAAVREFPPAKLSLAFVLFCAVLANVETTGFADVSRTDFFFLYLSLLAIQEYQAGNGNTKGSTE